MAATPKRHFPAFLDLDRRLCIVIGDGEGVEKRVRQLLRYDADVVVITAAPTEWLIQSESDGLITVENRSYVRGDLEGAFVALCVATDPELGRAVFAEAESIGCLVNVADAPELCNFLLPSVLHRGSLQVAISTAGIAPTVARHLRKQLDADLGPEWERWVVLLGEVRAAAMREIEDDGERRRIIDAASTEAVRERLAAGEEVTAAGLLAEFGTEKGATE